MSGVPDGLSSTRAVVRHLVPLDMADGLPDLSFGPTRIARFGTEELADLFDAPRLGRLYLKLSLDLARLAQFHWPVVEEAVELDPRPEQRSVPILFTDRRDLRPGGLAPDELPIIARRGKEVLTEGNPRHRNNIGANDGAAPTGGNTSIFNLFDPNDLAEKILGSPSGDKMLINHVRDNQAAYKAALG